MVPRKRQAIPTLTSFFLHGDVGRMDVRGGRTISAPALFKRSALYPCTNPSLRVLVVVLDD